MNILKFVIVLAIAAGAYQYWNKHRHGANAVASVESSGSRNGFVPLPVVSGASSNAVLVVAAENCPEDAGQRADRLADQLGRNGVPVTRLHNVSFEIPNGDSAIAGRVMSIMNGELPIVIVRGRAKSNPSLEEVTAEYNAN